jgi:hypothetical protein
VPGDEEIVIEMMNLMQKPVAASRQSAAILAIGAKETGALPRRRYAREDLQRPLMLRITN